MDKILLNIALVGYFVSTTGYLGSLLIKRIFLAKISTWLLAFAFFFHTATLFTQYVLTGQNPVTNIYGSISFFAWVIAGAYLIFQIRTKTRTLGSIVSPLTFLLVLVASQLLHGGGLLPKNIQGPLVTIHVMLSVTGEALFVLVALAGWSLLRQLAGSLRGRAKGGCPTCSRCATPPIRDALSLDGLGDQPLRHRADRRQ